MFRGRVIVSRERGDWKEEREENNRVTNYDLWRMEEAGICILL